MEPALLSGEYRADARKQEPDEAAEQEELAAPEAAFIAITDGYSRDHREDLKQWMLVLVTTHDGDVPLFLRPLDGNSSDKAILLAVVTALQDQLREVDEEPSVYVADNGIYSESNMRRLNEAGVEWISRVLETLTKAQTILHESPAPDEWQRSEDGNMQCFARQWNCRKAQNAGSLYAQPLLSSGPSRACNDK